MTVQLNVDHRRDDLDSSTDSSTLDKPHGGQALSAAVGASSLKRGSGKLLVRSKQTGRIMISLAVTLAFLELLLYLGIVSSKAFPHVGDVVAKLFTLAGGLKFWQTIGATVAQGLMGLSIAVVLGLPLGILFGRLSVLDSLFRPIVEFLRPIPSITILPIVVLAIGVGYTSAVLLSALSSFWFIFIMTSQGAHSVDPVARDMLTIYRIPLLKRIRVFFIPSVLPTFLTALRVASAVAIIVAITAELLIGIPGLGYAVQIALQSADTVGMFAYIVAAGFVGLGINWLVVGINRVLLRRHPKSALAGSAQ